MKKISDFMTEEIHSVAIFGHVRPDGDCLGSTLGLYHYLHDNYPEVEVHVYLEGFSDHFAMIPGTDMVEKKFYQDEAMDLCVVLDCSTPERIGAGGALAVEKIANTLCVDHHMANDGAMCRENIVDPDISSASELLMDLLDRDKIGYETACCLYMGMAHDTGVFQFQATTAKTLEKVGFLIEKKIPFTEIVQKTYYSRGLNQIRATGHVLETCKTALDNRVIYGYLTYDDMKTYKVNSKDMDGIVDALREYDACDVAIFMYPLRDAYKLSVRSKDLVDVNAVCQAFGGGGHIRAAGCQMQGAPEELIAKVVEEIAKQLA